MYELRTGLYAHKFATFWMLPKRFYHNNNGNVVIVHA